jgi:hypothetical protein
MITAIVRVWDVQAKQQLRELHTRAYSIAPVGTNKIAIATVDSIFIKDWRTGELVNHIHCNTSVTTTGKKCMIAFGSFLVAAMRNYELCIWNIKIPGGKLVKRINMKEQIRRIEPTTIGLAIMQDCKISFLNMKTEQIDYVINSYLPNREICMFDHSTLVYTSVMKESDERDKTIVHFWNVKEKRKTQSTTLNERVKQLICIGEKQLLGNSLFIIDDYIMDGIMGTHLRRVIRFDGGIAGVRDTSSICVRLFDHLI